MEFTVRLDRAWHSKSHQDISLFGFNINRIWRGKWKQRELSTFITTVALNILFVVVIHVLTSMFKWLSNFSKKMYVRRSIELRRYACKSFKMTMILASLLSTKIKNLVNVSTAKIAQQISPRFVTHFLRILCYLN